jgi:hypothetical protein
MNGMSGALNILVIQSLGAASISSGRVLSSGGRCLEGETIDYINSKGMDTIRDHARDFIAKREAPAVIPNDGKQTLTKGHPVFPFCNHNDYNICRLYNSVSQKRR